MWVLVLLVLPDTRGTTTMTFWLKEGMQRQQQLLVMTKRGEVARGI
jgi:nitrate/nitrite-specific signal transduction histidine kinase